MKDATQFPAGWDEERVQRILQHYESPAEDEAVLADMTQTVMAVPKELAPAVQALIASHTQ